LRGTCGVLESDIMPHGSFSYTPPRAPVSDIAIKNSSKPTAIEKRFNYVLFLRMIRY